MYILTLNEHIKSNEFKIGSVNFPHEFNKIAICKHVPVSKILNYRQPLMIKVLMILNRLEVIEK